jgi:hypothetical protein
MVSDEHLKYVDVRVARNGPRIERRLDLLSATYLGLQDQVAKYTFFIVDAAHEFRPEKIAFRFYGNKNKWRFICMFNGVVNPLQDLYAGRQLRIPDLNEIEKLLTVNDQNRVQTGIVEI